MINYVQAAPNASVGSFHIQATGPAFPKGYASGDLALKGVAKREVFIPSMRGSGRLYFQLTDAEVKANLVEIVNCLYAPSPAYSAADVNAVANRVDKSVAVAKQGPTPKVVAAAPCDDAFKSKVIKGLQDLIKSLQS